MNTFRLRFVAVLVIAAIMQACGGGDPNIESAKLNIRNQDFTAAIASTDRAIANNPDNADAYVWKARALSARASANRNVPDRASDYTAMNAALEKARTLLENSTDPKSVLAALQLDDIRDDAWRLEHATGVNYVNKDTVSDAEMQSAINHMKNAVAIYPDSTMSARVLSEIYFMAGDTEQAGNYLKEVLEKPGVEALPEDYVRLLYFLRESGQTAELATALDKAVAMYPDNKEIKIEIANTFISQAEYDKAADTMREIISLDAENAEYRYIYATLLFEAISNEITNLIDNYTVAFDLRTEYRDVARQSTSTANTQRLNDIEKELAELNAENDRIGTEIDRLGDVVITQLSEAVRLEPEEPKYHSLLGSIYDVKANVLFNKGNEQTDLAESDRIQNQAKEIWRQALPHIKRATELDPDNRDNWALISRVYIRLGMMEEAQQAMERSEQ